MIADEPVGQRLIPAAMGDLALRLTSLAKALPGGRRLFDGLALTLEAGEHVAIRGESGAGKSTLLNIIAGLDTADSGEVMVAGTDLARLEEARRTALRRDAIGFVFQALHILPNLDLVRNVAFGRRVAACRDRARWCMRPG